MSLTFAVEPVELVWNEMMVLAHQHWQGTKSYRRHEPFNPSFDRYQACNQSGFYQQFTARDHGTMVGYFGVYITNSMHSQKRMATEDTFYLDPSHRGGRNALRFLAFIESQCRTWGVEEIMFSCEQDNDSGIQRLLMFLDFQPVIMQYSKRLIRIPPADSGLSSHQETPADVCTQSSPGS